MNLLFKEADNNMYREKLHQKLSARSAIVQGLIKALEARDFITEGHGDRLQALAESFARIYYRNAINNGYPVLFVKGLSQGIKDGKINDGDELEVDLATGTIANITQNSTFHGDAVADLENEIMAAGGLIPYLKAQAAQ